MTEVHERIAAAFRAACRDELELPKPGNVHAFAPGHGMTVDVFLRSAEAAAVPLAMPRARIGARICAVEATHAAVGMNTNLGIVLLCAPLAAAAEKARSDFRDAVAHALADLDVADAQLAFKAIMRASPGGLGHANRHDVAEPAQVTLKEAMGEAADRDRIAHQYVSDFEDIFAVGEPLLKAAIERGFAPKWATVAVYLGFLAAFPDTHIVRRHGTAAADRVRLRAGEFQRRLDSAGEPADLLADLLAWDAELKQAALNPGTSADLTVATLFVQRLRVERLAVRTQQ